MLRTSTVVGEVIFDRNHPDQPPDVIFSPKDEATNFSPRLEQLPVSMEEGG